jgi:TonB family protein
MLLSVILPLFTLHTSRPLDIQFFGKMLNDVFISASNEEAYSVTSWIKMAGAIQTVYTIYIIGVALFLLKLAADLLNLILLIIKHREDGSRIIRFHSFNTSGFSAMGFIFLNSKLNPAEAEEIIRHEQNHLRRKHFIDIVFIELLKAFQWFNPAAYLFDRSIRAIHEYQADQECLNSGIPLVNYQNLLMNQIFSTRTFNLTNSFSNPSLVKKRMEMMTKSRTSALAAIKLAAVIPVAGIVFLAISAYGDIPSAEQQAGTEINNAAIPVLYGPDAFNSDPEESGSVPFVVVEEMPAFPGGDTELLKYIGQKTIYPEKAKVNNIQGRVIVRFCVNENGGVDRISILKGVDPELDAEAVRVVSSLPGFIPGKQGGKAVPVWYMVPITFTLR